MKKHFGPTKYPREKMSDPPNTLKKRFRIHEGTRAQWYEIHETHIGTRPMEFGTLILNNSVSSIGDFDACFQFEFQLDLF